MDNEGGLIVARQIVVDKDSLVLCVPPSVCVRSWIICIIKCHVLMIQLTTVYW